MTTPRATSREHVNTRTRPGFLPCFGPPPSVPTNEFLLLGEGPDPFRPDNKVVTAKFTALNFLPYSFFGQFQYFSNSYFLVIFIVAQIGDSGLNWYQSPYQATGFLLSLAVVVGVNMVFEGWYDFGRHREDRRVNNRVVVKLNKGGGEEKVTWQSLRPGDVVCVERDHMFPADLLFLRAFVNPEAHVEEGDEFDEGKCYVETSNIDGETNLKVRLTPPVNELFNRVSKSMDWCEKLQDWTMQYDIPKPALEFSGVLKYEGDFKDDDVENRPPFKRSTPLEFNNVLLRGSILKNTFKVVGVVIYAGTETKSTQSASATRSKISNATKLVNRAILVILFVAFLMVVISAAVSAVQPYELYWYLGKPAPYVFGPFFSSFFTFVILYSGILPISLVIAITLTNVIQAYFVNTDLEMYHAENDRPARCRTLELAQEIGQVAFVFSDKTGTLTRNEMKLVGCSVGADRSLGLGEFPYDSKASDAEPNEIFKDLLECVEGKGPQGHKKEVAREFLAILSICHTVLAEVSHGELKYNAEGPDEEALVGGVAMLGFKLVKTSRSIVVVESQNMAHRYSSSTSLENRHSFEILAINPFDSTRKRMSAVVRLPNGTIELMVKGADSVMIERLTKRIDDDERWAMGKIGDHLNRFAENGLRTLVIGRRHVSIAEYDNFAKALEDANCHLGTEKHRLQGEAAELLEHSLHIVGASAIEDRLQDGVPETLACLRDAGIKTWVLTGDKVETAINIGFSSGLLLNDMQLVQITSSDSQGNLAQLQKLAEAIDPKTLETLKYSLITPMAASESQRYPKLFTSMHSRRSRGVSMDLEASYDVSTANVVGGIAENGFHALASAAAGGRKMVRQSIGRVSRASIREDGGGLGKGEKGPPRPTSAPPTASFHGSILRVPSPTHVAGVRAPTPTPTSASISFAMRLETPPAPAGTTAAVTLHDSLTPESVSPRASPKSSEDAETARSSGTTEPCSFQHPERDDHNGTSRNPLLITPDIAEAAAQIAVQRDDAFEASKLALVVSGAALADILQDVRDENPGTKRDPRKLPITDKELLFLSVAKVCKVVIACRVSPRQKALLVRLVRRGIKVDGKEPITLAIGDGANDVAMIQEARVGVGIAGREGSQAVNAADFSIGQFSFLRRLLLVHGRWNYRRMALLVLYIFYSHLLPVLAAFAYNFINMWSGTGPYLFVWVIAYSYIVVIPAIILAAFNRDISAETALRYPAIYVSGRANLHLGKHKILEYIFKAIAHASIICGLVYGTLAPLPISYVELGTIIYWIIVLTVLSRLALECYTWTWISILFYVIFLVLFFPIETILYAADADVQMFYFGTGAPASVLFGDYAQITWSITFLVVVISILLDVSLTVVRRVFYPNLVDIIIELDRGYSPDKATQLGKTNEVMRSLTRPLTLPVEAVAASVAAASKTLNLAPKFRSAYAYDAPDQGETENQPVRKPPNRFRRFSFKESHPAKKTLEPLKPVDLNSTQNSDVVVNVTAQGSPTAAPTTPRGGEGDAAAQAGVAGELALPAPLASDLLRVPSNQLSEI